MIPIEGWRGTAGGPMDLDFTLAAGLTRDKGIRGHDWTGVVVGHWYVNSPGDIGSGGKRVWWCYSACGVRSPFRADSLAAGATRTCEACRPGATPPPPARVATGGALAAIMAVMKKGRGLVQVKSNIVGEGRADWEEHGNLVLDRIIRATGLGFQFGWKVLVRDAHRKKAKDAVPARIRVAHDAVRKLELVIPGLVFRFDVDVSTGRTDVTWDEIKRKIQAAVAAEQPAADPPTPEASVATTNGKHPPPQPAAPAGTEDRLLKLRSGLDRAIEVSRDNRAAADLRAEIGRRIAAAKANADPLRAAFEAATTTASATATAAAKAKDEADAIAAKLKAAVEMRDRLAADSDKAAKAAAYAATEYAPARDRLAAAEAELAEAERMEAERARVQAAAGDVAVLLAALEKLGIS